MATAITPKTTTNSPTTKKPTNSGTADKGNDDRSSGTDVTTSTTTKTRAIEYDLEGSAQVRPIKGINARQMIDFQGLGNNFSGKYFLSSVVHTINRSGGYTMELDLLRKGFDWKITKPPSPTPTPTPPKKPPSPGTTYTVKKGDTLWSISKRFYGTSTKWTTIYNANKSKIKDPNKIYPGQVLTIP